MCCLSNDKTRGHIKDFLPIGGSECMTFDLEGSGCFRFSSKSQFLTFSLQVPKCFFSTGSKMLGRSADPPDPPLMWPLRQIGFDQSEAGGWNGTSGCSCEKLNFGFNSNLRLFSLDDQEFSTRLWKAMFHMYMMLLSPYLEGKSKETYMALMAQSF